MAHNFQTAEDIVSRLRTADQREYAALERALHADTRITVQKALAATKKRLDAEGAEQARIQALYSFDRAVSSGTILGMDEVGRGPLAGPLAVGGVVLNYEKPILGLNDSKKLSHVKREQLADEVKRFSLASVVHYIPAEEIDANGMAASLRKAFSAVIAEVEEMGISLDAVLIDGVPIHIDSREQSVVKGDGKSACIAAASIIAKVARDKLMCKYAQQYPEYCFEQNKGYASPAHIAAIETYGLCPLHRASFCTAFTQERLF